MIGGFDIQAMLEAMDDAELMTRAAEVRDDLAKAAAERPESEWHQACFAGAVILGGEMQKRGLTLATIH